MSHAISRKSRPSSPWIAMFAAGVISIMCAGGVTVAAEDAGKLFKRSIAPVLEQRCASCHNPDKREGSLDVTSRDSFFEGGDSRAAVVSGKAEESILLDMVTGAKPEMPKNAKPLTEEEIASRGENMIKASTFDSPYQIAFTNGEQASVTINLQTTGCSADVHQRCDGQGDMAKAN